MGLYSVPLQNAVQKSLDATLSAGATTMTLNEDVSALFSGVSATNPGVCVIDRIDSSESETPTKREYVIFTGVSTTNLTGLTRNADSSGSDQEHAVGAIVEFVPDVLWAKSIKDNMVTLTGTETLTNKTLTSPVINGAMTGTTTPPLTFFGANFNSPEGFLINGKILPSISANDLVVAIKGMDNNNPSAANPVYCRIGNVVRSITSALSVTCADGINWFDSGSSEHATQEIDYFVYLGYNATDGVVVGISRIPYGREYGSFSTTNTASNFCAISTITNASVDDDYLVIGRIPATLSAGAGYTWTIPTLNNINLIQTPIYETRWMNWLPTYTGCSANPTHTCRYKISDRILYLMMSGTAGGTSNATTKTITLPLIPVSLSGTISWVAPVSCVDNGALIATQWGKVRIADSNIACNIYTSPSTGVWTASGVFYWDFEAWYEV